MQTICVGTLVSQEHIQHLEQRAGTFVMRFMGFERRKYAKCVNQSSKKMRVDWKDRIITALLALLWIIATYSLDCVLFLHIFFIVL